MTTKPADRDDPIRGTGILIGLIVLCTSIELFLSLSDWGLIDIPRLRQTVYEFGGFWPGLLANWRPNYPGQPFTMFFTYAFLHGGPLHLLMNMITLWSLGRAVLDRAGPAGFVVVYTVSALSGAFLFGLLATSLQPMVGDSGALFGLAGALLGWSLIERVAFHDSLWPVARVAALLVAINVVMWWALDGQLAWQTHLGGFVGGLFCALLLSGTDTSPD